MGPDNRSLDLDWLEDFVALAETGNFSRAAEARAIAQTLGMPHGEVELILNLHAA